MEALANPKHLPAMGVWVGGMTVGVMGMCVWEHFFPGGCCLRRSCEASG